MKIETVRDFHYEEFIPEEEFKEYMPQWFSNLIDPRIPILAQFVRDRFACPVIINNWAYIKDGEYRYNYSGWRPQDCKIGSKNSRHKLGLCIDVKVKRVPAPDVQEDILKNKKMYMNAGLTAMEMDTPTWTHLSVEDTSWRREDSIWLIPLPINR